MDPEHDLLRPKYRLCRVAFALVGFGLGLLAVSAAIEVAILTTPLVLTPLFRIDPRALVRLTTTRFWTWGVSAPITWTTLVGAYLLWGRWSDASWQRRAGLLLMMNLADLTSWAISNREVLGLHLGPVGHGWLRQQISEGLGWAEFALFAGLAVDVAYHLGAEEAVEKGHRARFLVAAGAILWLVGFLNMTDWRRGWPLQPRGGLLIDESYLMLLGSSVLTLITCLNVAALCALACRRCARALVEMHQEDQGHDLLRSRSEMVDDDFWTR